MLDSLEAVNDGNFTDTVAGSAEPFLVEFTAPWCGPCAALEPVLAEIALEKVGKLRVGQLDISENPELTERFGVLTTPTMILFEKGEPIRRLMGAKGKRNLLEALSDYID